MADNFNYTANFEDRGCIKITLKILRRLLLFVSVLILLNTVDFLLGCCIIFCALFYVIHKSEYVFRWKLKMVYSLAWSTCYRRQVHMHLTSPPDQRLTMHARMTNLKCFQFEANKNFLKSQNKCWGSSLHWLVPHLPNTCKALRSILCLITCCLFCRYVLSNEKDSSAGRIYSAF